MTAPPVDVADVGAIGTLGPHFDLMRPVPRVELLVAWRQTTRQARVALARARIPPAADFPRTPRIPQVHDHVNLIVVRVGGIEVRHAGGEMRELAVDEPQAMDAARADARRVEEREREILQRLRPLDALEVRHVQRPHARELLSLLERLVGHRQFQLGLVRRHKELFSRCLRASVAIKLRASQAVWTFTTNC